MYVCMGYEIITLISVYPQHHTHCHVVMATMPPHVHTAIPTNLAVVSTPLPMSQPSKIFEISPKLLFCYAAILRQLGWLE